MWFDCEANYATLSHPDSIRFYLEKCRDLGFNNAVVDVKSIMGEVVDSNVDFPQIVIEKGATKRGTQR